MLTWGQWGVQVTSPASPSRKAANMKLIEALKQMKELQRKASDLRTNINRHCAISTLETPLYPDQKKKMDSWLQSHGDLVKEILRLRVAVQRTNLETEVTIELGGKLVTKTIAEWIHRRRDLAGLELQAWRKLTDRNIQEGQAPGPGGNVVEVKIVRFYDPEERDRKVDLYDSEPALIDGKLEIANAVTDLIE